MALAISSEPYSAKGQTPIVTAPGSRPNPPFRAAPFSLEIPQGTLINFRGEARGDRPLRIIIKEGRTETDEAGNETLTDVVPIQVFEPADISPRSIIYRYRTTRPIILYEIQEQSADGSWVALDLPNRFPDELGRGTPIGTVGITRVMRIPVVEGAEYEPALSFWWGGVVRQTTYATSVSGEITVLDRDAFDFVLHGARSKASEAIIAELKTHANTGVFGDIDRVETRRMKHDLHYQKVRFNFHWEVEDLFKNIPPLGDCDCDAYLAVDIEWRVDRLGMLLLSHGPITSDDVHARCGLTSCPFHDFAILFAKLLTIPPKTLLGERILGQLPSEIHKAYALAVDQFMKPLPAVLPANATLVGNMRARLNSMWISPDGKLKANITVSMNYRI